MLLPPATAQAVSTARLFAKHQRERQQAGLPPEGGREAALLQGVASALAQGGGWMVGVVAWVLLAVAWEAAAVFGVPAEQRGWK